MPPTAPPAPDPADVWRTQHLYRVPVGAGFQVQSDVHTYSAVEFAAITHDSALVRSFLTRERASRRESRGMLIFGGVIGGLGLAELVQVATLGQDAVHTEDHLWRGILLTGVAVVPLTFSLSPVRLEQARRDEIALSYSAAEADGRIAAYNSALRTSLGLPTEAAAATNVRVVLPPAVPPPAVPPPETPPPKTGER